MLWRMSERDHLVEGWHLRYDLDVEKPDTGERVYIDPGLGRITKVQIGTPPGADDKSDPRG